MTAPRVDIHLDRITDNTRRLVGWLAPKGIRVTGVTKATLGSPAVGEAMLRGGAAGLGDSRVENLARLRSSGVRSPSTLIRSPMVSQVDAVVSVAATSLNTESVVIDALALAAVGQGTSHAVVLMVELGDLREGLAVGDVAAVAAEVRQRPGLTLAGIGTNLACQSGVVPDQRKMDELSRLADEVESACGPALSVVSGGNSANLDWALSTDDVGRIDELRLGEAILLGTEPLHRERIADLRTDAFTLVAEVIEVKTKPAQPSGSVAQGAFGVQPARSGTGLVRQAILAVGRQDVDPVGVMAPDGMTVLGMSSDHLVVDVGDLDVYVGDEVAFRLDYAALVRAMTSPFVAKVEHGGGPPRPAAVPDLRVVPT